MSRACCILSVLFVRIDFELSTVEFVVASSPAYSNAGSNPWAVASVIDCCSCLISEKAEKIVRIVYRIEQSQFWIIYQMRETILLNVQFAYPIILLNPGLYCSN